MARNGARPQEKLRWVHRVGFGAAPSATVARLPAAQRPTEVDVKPRIVLSAVDLDHKTRAGAVAAE